jgi:hypothetical protein
MILEQIQQNFQRLFLWQLEQHGAPSELGVAEQAARSGRDSLDTSASAEVKEWYGSPAVRSWLNLDPALSGIPLGQYFFFSRDRLLPAAPEARLSANLQALLSKLQSDTPAQRRMAIEEAAKLPSEEYGPLYETVLELASRRPESVAMSSALELTAKIPSTWPRLVGALAAIPPRDVPIDLPLKLATVGKDIAEVQALFVKWDGSNITKLRKAVGQARGGSI